MKRIYLDHAATTACEPEVASLVAHISTENFGNANSPHYFGQQARKLLDDARQEVAEVIGAMPNDIMFNSGATEGSNHVIRSLAADHPQGHIIATAIEHHCVMAVLALLSQQGYAVSYIKPKKDGMIDVDDLIKARQPHTFLVICQHANNEIGTIQPVTAIGQWCRQEGIAFFVDAVQTVGHFPVKVNELCCDFLSLSAHKFYGPKGVGVLYHRQQRVLKPWILGGDQERGLRAGTVNVAHAVGLAKALRMAEARLTIDAKHDEGLRDFIIQQLLTTIEDVQLNGDRQQRLFNNVHVSIQGIDSEQLIAALDMRGIAVSMGSACSAGRLSPSHVLKAIDLPDHLALAALRVTVGRHTSMNEAQYFCDQLREVVRQLRQASKK